MEWLRKIKEKALAVYKEKEMPSFKYGLHLKLNLEELNFNEIDVNDNKAELSIENAGGITAESFDNASDLAGEYFMKTVKIDEDIFTAFHTAFLSNGLLVNIPENFKAEKPLLIKTNSLGTFLADHLIIIAGKNSKADIIKTVSSNSEKKGYRSGIVEIYAKEGAEVNFAGIQGLDQNRYNFSIKRAVVETHGAVNWLTCTIGSRHTRLEVSSILKGEGAKTNNWGLYFGSKTQLFDFAYSTVHSAPHTTSDILTKGVLNESAKSVFRGLIKMEKSSAGSNGYQKGDALLLSESAEADAIPKLEIDNNDVKCSHGASIGQVDKEKLFYMMARGISEEDARKKIVEGFLEPMIKKISVAEIQEEMRASLHRKC